MALPLPRLPSIRDLIRVYGLSSKHQLAQHFLMDLNITDKLVRSVGGVRNKVVLEVGPGPGSLTRSILNGGAAAVVAIEKDQRFRPALETLQNASNGRLHLVFDDVLDVDETGLIGSLCEPEPWESEDSRLAILGNLPFNVSTALTVKWLKQIGNRSGVFAHGRPVMGLMFQKEVAERMMAGLGTREYGRLSVMTQRLCQVEHAMTLPPKLFVPPPKVTSTFVSLRPLVEPVAEAPMEALEELLRNVFSYRRKQLFNSLSATDREFAEVAVSRTSVVGTMRPQMVSISQYCELAREFAQHSSFARRPT